MPRINPAPDVGSCPYGAPMGRRETEPGYRTDLDIKFHLVKVRINSGGYDDGGAYWGLGQPLYYAEGFRDADDEYPDLEFSRYFRAVDRDAAKQVIRDEFPNARFYR